MSRKVYFLDFETTGKDPQTCRPIEVAIGSYDIDARKLINIESHLIWDSTYPPISEEISRLTGITQEMLQESYEPPHVVFTQMIDTFTAEREAKDTIVVAHNGASFDKVVFEQECQRQGLIAPRIVWVDTRRDVKYGINSACRVLSHLVLEHGHIVDPSTLHRAKADIKLMETLLSGYDFKEIFKRAVARRIVLAAEVTFDQKDLAREKGFRWQKLSADDPRTFNKRWVYEVIEPELLEFRESCSFSTTIVG